MGQTKRGPAAVGKQGQRASSDARNTATSAISGGADFERILDYVDVGIDFVRRGMDAAAKAAHKT